MDVSERMRRVLRRAENTKIGHLKKDLLLKSDSVQEYRAYQSQQLKLFMVRYR